MIAPILKEIAVKILFNETINQCGNRACELSEANVPMFILKQIYGEAEYNR